MEKRKRITRVFLLRGIPGMRRNTFYSKFIKPQHGIIMRIERSPPARNALKKKAVSNVMIYVRLSGVEVC